MIRNLTIAAALSLGVSHAALAANHTSGNTMNEIPQDVILATSVIGMPTFIKGEENTVGPIGSLADAIVSLQGEIQGVVIRTPQGRAFAVPADKLEQGRVNDRPVLLIDITRADAEGAADVSQQMGQAGQQTGGGEQSDSGADDMQSGSDSGSGDGSSSADGSTEEQDGVTGTTVDGTNAAGNNEGDSGTGTEGRAGTDGESMSNSSADDGSSSSDDNSSDSGSSSGDDGSMDGSSNGSSSTDGASDGVDGVTGTTVDGTNAAGNNEGDNGTGTEGRAGTDGEPLDLESDADTEKQSN